MVANPAVLFVFIWSLLIWLFSLGVLELNVPYSFEALAVVGFNLLSAVGLFFCFPGRRAGVDFKKIARRILSRHQEVRRYWLWLFCVYGAITAFDVVYSGGVPLLWKLTGDPREYVDFGIPTLHGLANAVVFFLASFGVVLIRLKLERIRLLLLLLFFWQIVILSRGTIMVMIVQMILVQLLVTRPSIRRVFYLSLFGMVVIISFGILGDIRQGENPYYGFVVNSWRGVFESMPSGFLWFYVYFVSGFNNFLYNAPLIDPTYLPVFTFAKLVPSAVYNIFDIEKAVDSFEFVNAGLNVSTIYSGFYSDFGLFAFLPVFFIQFIASYSFAKAQSGNILHLLSFSVCCQAIVFSPFIDTFFYLPFVSQFALIWVLKRFVLR